MWSTLDNLLVHKKTFERAVRNIKVLGASVWRDYVWTQRMHAVQKGGTILGTHRKQWGGSPDPAKVIFACAKSVRLAFSLTHLPQYSKNYLIYTFIQTHIFSSEHSRAMSSEFIESPYIFPLIYIYTHTHKERVWQCECGIEWDGSMN